MKKITLLVASVLFLNVANASAIIKNTDEETRTRFSFDEPISFTERGIEFFVFPNGDFDFNTRPEDSQGDYFYKGANKKGERKIERGGRPVNFGTLIEHDSFGRVRRVGNTFINYDTRDRVSRIGTVYMKYNRIALAQIGGMRLEYNRFGEITHMIGSVKGRRNAGFVYPQNNGPAYSSNTGNNGDYYYKEGKDENEKERK